MRRSSLALLTGLLCLSGLLAPTGASAAQFGTTCNADTSGPGVILNLAHRATSDGVITIWGMNVAAGAIPGIASYPQTLSVLSSPALSPWTVVGQSASVTTQGSFMAATRVPIKQGQWFNSSGVDFSLACSTPGVPDFYASATGVNATMGNSIAMSHQSDYTNAVWAEIEPDVDHDGYGDATQDKCPQLASTIFSCPAFALDAQFLALGPNYASFVATTNVDSTVTALGTVAFPTKGKVKAKPFKFSSKPLAASAGKLTKIILKYPTQLQKARKLLSKKRTFRLTATVTAKSVLGEASKTILIKVRGTK